MKSQIRTSLYFYCSQMHTRRVGFHFALVENTVCWGQISVVPISLARRSRSWEAVLWPERASFSVSTHHTVITTAPQLFNYSKNVVLYNTCQKQNLHWSTFTLFYSTNETNFVSCQHFRCLFTSPMEKLQRTWEDHSLATFLRFHCKEK